MPAVAKKSVKAAKPKEAEKKPKKQTLKKQQKTAEIKAAKQLSKLKAKKAISEKLGRAPVVKAQKAKHQFDPVKLNRGVLLVKNLPHGFYEKQLQKYFNQYGEVTRLRLARSERTGQSKHFAYIEFKYPEVAKIAAESMNNYIMFRQILKTVYIPPKMQNHDYFKQVVQIQTLKDGTKKVRSPAMLRVEKAVAEINKPVTNKQHAEHVERSKYKLKFLEKKLAKAGINVELSSQLYVSPETIEAEKKKAAKKEKKATAEAAPAKKADKTEVASAKPTKADKKKKSKKDTTESESAEKANTTLEGLLENTIPDESDEDDDDYEPTAEEIERANDFVNYLTRAEQSDDDENDTTLNKLLNDTIESDEGDDDEDYEPTEKEIAQAKIAAQAAAKKLKNVDSTKFVSKKKEVVAQPTKPVKNGKQKQNKRKLEAQQTTVIVKEAPVKKKAKANPKQKVVSTPVEDEPSTPKKVRTNFVTPPTPTPEPAKKEKKSKVKVAPVASPVAQKKQNKSKLVKQETAAVQPKKEKQKKKVAAATPAAVPTVVAKNVKKAKQSGEAVAKKAGKAAKKTKK